MGEVGTASYRTEICGKVNDRKWIYRLTGYGFSKKDILADDRAWSSQGWGIELLGTVWHYYPQYHNRAACHTTGITARGGLIARPKKLYKGPKIRTKSLRRYSQCKTCLNIKRSVEDRKADDE